MENQPTDSQISQLQLELDAARQENAKLQQRLGSQRRHRVRAAFAWAFLLLGLLLVLPAQMLIWANRTFINTDNYVAAVAPIIHERSVQQAIQKSAADALFSSVNIQAYVTQALPDQAKPLAAPITGQVKNYITSAIGQIVSSDRFATTWVKVNREVHQQFMTIATKSNGNPNINIDQLYGAISQSFAGTPLAPLAGKQLPASVGQINVVTVPALQRVPYYVSTLSDSRWLILGLAVGLLILALAVAPDRRRVAIGIGLGWMAVTVLGLVSVRVTRGILLAQIPDPVYNQAATDIWQALLKPLYLQTVILFITGAVIAAVGWLLGPAHLAVTWRTGLERGLGSGRVRLLPAADNAAWNRFLRRYHTGLLWALLLLTIVALLLLTPLTVASLSLVLVVAAIVWLVLEFLIAPAPG